MFVGRPLPGTTRKLCEILVAVKWSVDNLRTKSGFVSRLGRDVSVYIYCNCCGSGGQVTYYVKQLIEIFFGTFARVRIVPWAYV